MFIKHLGSPGKERSPSTSWRKNLNTGLLYSCWHWAVFQASQSPALGCGTAWLEMAKWSKNLSSACVQPLLLRAGGLGTTLPFTTWAKTTQHQLIKETSTHYSTFTVCFGQWTFFFTWNMKRPSCLPTLCVKSWWNRNGDVIRPINTFIDTIIQFIRDMKQIGIFM